jgi:hypothetical protein
MPGPCHLPSSNPYFRVPNVTYPLHDREVLVTHCGRICIYRKLGIKEVDDGIWIVSVMRYDLGFIDLEQKTLQPTDNPFGAGL